jgi:hypothetical protein
MSSTRTLAPPVLAFLSMIFNGAGVLVCGLIFPNAPC